MIPRTNLKQHPLPDNAAFTAVPLTGEHLKFLLCSSMDTVYSTSTFTFPFARSSTRTRRRGLAAAASRITRVAVDCRVSQYEYQSMSIVNRCRCRSAVAVAVTSLSSRVTSAGRRRSVCLGHATCHLDRPIATKSLGVRTFHFISFVSIYFLCSCAF